MITEDQAKRADRHLHDAFWHARSVALHKNPDQKAYHLDTLALELEAATEILGFKMEKIT